MKFPLQSPQTILSIFVLLTIAPQQGHIHLIEFPFFGAIGLTGVPFPFLPVLIPVKVKPVFLVIRTSCKSLSIQKLIVCSEGAVPVSANPEV